MIGPSSCPSFATKYKTRTATSPSAGATLRPASAGIAAPSTSRPATSAAASPSTSTASSAVCSSSSTESSLAATTTATPPSTSISATSSTTAIRTALSPASMPALATAGFMRVQASTATSVLPRPTPFTSENSRATPVPLSMETPRQSTLAQSFRTTAHNRRMPKSHGNSSTRQGRQSLLPNQLRNPSPPTALRPSPLQPRLPALSSGPSSHPTFTLRSSPSNPAGKQPTPNASTLASAPQSSMLIKAFSSTANPSRFKAPAITRITPA